MKPVHRESNLDVDYVISYKIPPDGTVSASAMTRWMLTVYRPPKSDRPIQNLDPVADRRGVADRSAQWVRQFIAGLRQGRG
jgi:hypothetical protein